MTSQFQNTFETFSDQLLLKVLSADTSSLDFYGSALVETIDRGLLGEDEFESLFKGGGGHRCRRAQEALLHGAV